MNESGWWLITNCHGGAHVGQGSSIGPARAGVRERIAEAFMAEGLSRSAAMRAASSYRLRLLAGPMPREEARACLAAWENEDWERALRHARPEARRSYGLSPRQDGKT